MTVSKHYLVVTLLVDIVVVTLALQPSPPGDLRVVGKTENAVFVQWTPPSGGGAVRGYRAVATPIKSYGENLGPVRSWEWLQPGLVSSSFITLSPATQYTLSLTSLGENGEVSSPTMVTTWTRIGIPEAPPTPSLEWQQGQRMGISLSPAKSNLNGPISFYRLALVDERGFFNKDSLVGWEEGTQLHLLYYIAAQWDDPSDLPYSFTLGDGDRLGGYYNGPLPSHGHWHPALGLGSTWENVTKIQYSPTGHYQHSHITLSNDQRAQEVVTVEDGGVVTGLWIAIGATSIILLLVLGVFLLLKLNLTRGKLSRRRSRREAHPLAQSSSYNQPSTSVSTISVPYATNEFNDCGGYTHLSFVPEEEDWGRKALLGLASIACIPRAGIVLPHSDEARGGATGVEDIPIIANGKFGPIFASLLQDRHPVQLFQLTIPSKVGNGGSSSWDEASFRALNSLLLPSSHVNVTSLSGFLQTEGYLYLVIPGEGTPLKTELHRTRSGEGSRSSQALLLCAMGVAEGLFHLHSYNLTHGELCSWSVVLPYQDDWANPKLTGFSILAANPVNKERDRNRWISVEQLHSRTAPPSDAWSFGVLLWEIATLGATPLHEIKTEDIKRRVERGARPPQLETFGDGLYQLMLSCWQIDKEERPDPETLACTLHELLPTANDELGIWDSFKWPPYIESLEFLPSTK
ncbi:putative tyrosine-protein kinase Wsck isoform X2 [Folsomia candida]|uniref:Putative tyrosine-protein kinase Wsck n=1 Tax=Folsomia candida TaxID=158441 RepID=A0A226CW74_FOLCA|nr:putative tyrosine-protein kinase Wsck isoform X2 [Folsomia candida]OXA36621.1 putative tyrosine-protein kinase Wsck [Folsomia candida]